MAGIKSGTEDILIRINVILKLNTRTTKKRQ